MKLVAIQKNNTNNNQLRLLSEKGRSFPKLTNNSRDLKFSANIEVELFRNIFSDHSLRMSFLIQWTPDQFYGARFTSCTEH